MATELALRRFTVDEYLEMGKAGILTEVDRVELIDGQIIQMSPIGDPHVEAVNRCLQAFLLAAAAGRVLPSMQNPLRVDRYNDPQPDIVLVPLGLRGAPRVADALLVIEVADTSLSYDRRIKLPLYARAGIKEAWLVDLKAEALEVHREPGPGGYTLISRCRRGERVAPVAFPDLEIAVDDLLPLVADSAAEKAPDA